MKKILLINGSPKKEHSATLYAAQAFVHGLEDSLECEVSTLHLASLYIKPCTGCLNCWGRTPGICVVTDDDMPRVWGKVLESDIIIESFPLYFFGMPGPVKTFTDRMLGMMNTYTGGPLPENGQAFHRVRFHKKERKLVVISSCAFTEATDVFEPLCGQLDLVCGRGGYTLLRCPQLKTLVDLGPSSRLTRYLAGFEGAGRAFAEKGGLSGEDIARLEKPPFSPETYRMLLDKFWNQEKEGSDG